MQTSEINDIFFIHNIMDTCPQRYGYLSATLRTIVHNVADIIFKP